MLGYDSVRDYDRLNGKYRGAAHNQCNLNANTPKIVLVCFYNGSKYDNHLFVKELFEGKPDYIKFEVFAKAEEEYFSVYFGCIRILDAFRFLKSICPYDYITGSFDDVNRIISETNNST